ncbi:hypothetical protein pb186bvf_000051 [Paramecium bursaria]
MLQLNVIIYQPDDKLYSKSFNNSDDMIQAIFYSQWKEEYYLYYDNSARRLFMIDEQLIGIQLQPPNQLSDKEIENVRNFFEIIFYLSIQRGFKVVYFHVSKKQKNSKLITETEYSKERQSQPNQQERLKQVSEEKLTYNIVNQNYQALKEQNLVSNYIVYSIIYNGNKDSFILPLAKGIYESLSNFKINSVQLHQYRNTSGQKVRARIDIIQTRQLQKSSRFVTQFEIKDYDSKWVLQGQESVVVQNVSRDEKKDKQDTKEIAKNVHKYVFVFKGDGKRIAYEHNLLTND